jgi:hypothetical protein
MVEQWEDIEGGIPRAPRFPLRLAMSYRQSGASAWQGATTENVSRSGVLFRAPRSPDPFGPLDMTFVLPAHVLGEPEARVLCRGQVVRVGSYPTGESAIAATILEYELMRGAESGDL